MNELSLAKKRINSLYRTPQNNIYSHRFFQDLCTGFSFVLGEYTRENDFIYFEPAGCAIETLLRQNKHYNLSYEIEEVLYNVIGSLLRYGKAYLYLQPEYLETDDHSQKNISAVEMREILGYPSKKKSDTIQFYCKSFDGDVRKTELLSDGLIVFNLKDIGYQKNYFNKIVKRLGKLDTTASATGLLTESIPGYDFSEHLKHNRLKVLRETKEIGWYFGTDGLSDSYILYRKIQQDKLKLVILNYVVNKINHAIKALLKEQDAGEMKMRIKDHDYSQMWNDYNAGHITASELTRLLFSHH